MTENEERLSVFVFDGQGGSRTPTQSELEGISIIPLDSYLWANMQLPMTTPPKAFQYACCVIDDYVKDALLATESRPRCTLHEDGVILNLRAVNFNPGEDPEDMVSVRIWAERDRVVTTHFHDIQPLEQIESRIRAGHAPKSVADLITDIAFRLTENMEPVIGELSDDLDELEEEHDTLSVGVARTRLTELRRQAIMLRRFIAPQRDAINHLTIEEIDWIDERHRARLREATDRVTRYAEELDAIRERAAILHDQLTDRRAEQMNQQMLILTIAAAIFLPLTYIAGIMGMNVGGIPGATWPYAFWIVLVVSFMIGAGLLLVFRIRHWF